MVNRRADDLRDMPDDELEVRLSEAKAELFNLRFRHVTGQLDNSARLGEMRREIARINTILRHREIEAAERIAAEAGGAATTEGVTNG